MDIKDILISGNATADELLEQFKAQLNEAQKAANAEKAKREAEAAKAKAQAKHDEDLDDAREDMVDAIIDYLVALGVLDEDDIDDEDMEGLMKAIKSAEQEMLAYAKIGEMLKGLEKNAKQEGKDCHSVRKTKPVMDEDKVLANFLAQIM